MIQAIIPKMVERKSDTIIIVTSLGGRVPLPFLSPYSMSKYALENAGAALDIELESLEATDAQGCANAGDGMRRTSKRRRRKG